MKIAPGVAGGAIVAAYRSGDSDTTARVGQIGDLQQGIAHDRRVTAPNPTGPARASDRVRRCFQKIEASVPESETAGGDDPTGG